VTILATVIAVAVELLLGTTASTASSSTTITSASAVSTAAISGKFIAVVVVVATWAFVWTVSALVPWLSALAALV
jgi:hypothetical protein